MELQRLTSSPAKLGEGPCWHADEGALYWVDILGQRLHRFDPGTERSDWWDMPEMIGTVAPRRSGGLIVALQNDLFAFDPTSGTLERLLTVDPDPRTRMNDGKCDAEGRFWVGTMDIEEKQAIGGLYCVHPSGEVQQWLEGVGISNGMTWSPDQRRMAYIDSPTRKVDVFDFSPSAGTLSRRRTLAVLGEDEGFPDGMTSDLDGNLWIAHWGGARLTRRDGQTGECLDVYPTHAWQTSACCFGGPRLKDLYITSARVQLTSEQEQEYPDSGHLLRATLPDVTGYPTHAFAG